MPFLLSKRSYRPTLNEHSIDVGKAVVEEVIDMCVYIDGKRFARAAIHDGFLIVGKPLNTKDCTLD